MSYGKLGVDFNDAEGFKKFWEGSELREFRDEFNSYPHTNCITCPDWTNCGGGCKIKWLHYDPKDYIGRRKERPDYA